MTPGWAPSLALVVCVTAVILAAMFYFSRFELPRPPIGVFRGSDIAMMSVMVVVTPMGYLALPRTAVGSLFAFMFLMAVQLVLAPLIGGGPSYVAAAALGAAALASWQWGTARPTVVLADVILAMGVVGVSNLWVQGGLRASHTAWLAGLLAIYDLVATGLTDATARLADEVRGLPFAPVFVVTGGGQGVSIGLGDLLMLALFPLAATRVYGRTAGLVAALSGIGLSATVSLLFWSGVLHGALPLLVLLGPLIVIQHLFWRHRGLRERTTEEWRAGASSSPSEADPLHVLEDALAMTMPEWIAEGVWTAIVDGSVVGTGASPGLARRDARANGHAGVPVTRQA